MASGEGEGEGEGELSEPEEESPAKAVDRCQGREGKEHAWRVRRMPGSQGAHGAATAVGTHPNFSDSTNR